MDIPDEFYNKIQNLERKISKIKTLHAVGELDTRKAKEEIKFLLLEMELLVRREGEFEHFLDFKYRKEIGRWPRSL